MRADVHAVVHREAMNEATTIKAIMIIEEFTKRIIQPPINLASRIFCASVSETTA